MTLFTDRGELVALEELLYRWGFVYYGIKHNGGKEEKVLVKFLHKIIDNGTPKLNYPNISHLCNKFILEVFESPKNLSDFGVAVAPQSFVYIKIE